MKYLVHAIAILAAAEKKVEEDYNRERMSLINKLEQQFAERRRLLAHAKRSVEKRFALDEGFNHEIWEKLRPARPTDAETTKRMRRGFLREQKAKQMSSGNFTGQKRGTR